MGTEKITQLNEILKLDPQNSFARYGVAMEYMSHGDTKAALSSFDELLTGNPEYVPGYFMSAQLLADVGQNDEAIARLEAGILHAQRIANNHAVSEMRSLLETLQQKVSAK